MTGSDEESQKIKCALCGYMFDEKNGKASCKGCFMSGGCGLLRCPNCGYETPREPAWFKKILKRRNKKNGTDGQR
jgi:hypothetical protein